MKTMKKLLCLLLAVCLLAAMVGCSAKKENSDDDNKVETKIDPLTLLNTAWDGVAEDAKFAAVGGDAENSTDNAAGTYSIADAAELDRQLGFPEAEIGSISSAAALFHMMNLNNFTCGAYQLNDGVDAAALAETVRANIQARHWMCGFPEKLVIVSAGGCLVAMFGLEQNTTAFTSALSAAYSDAAVLVDEPIE